MRRISFSTKVHAPFDVIWEVMRDRIEHPPAGSLKVVRILERQEHFVVREVQARWLLITEHVTIDQANREIHYTIAEHPFMSGRATVRAVPLSRQNPVAPVQLSMVVDWAPKTEDAERKVLASMPDEVKDEVESIRDEAEARARKVGS